MSSLSLLVHQFRFAQKIFWRNPAAVFFTVALPLIFLLIFSGIFGDSEVNGVPTTTYYIPAILTLAVVGATAVSVAISLVADRESGRLKRGRSTPLPSWVYFAGRIGNGVVVSLLMLVVIVAIGAFAYGVPIPWERAPAILVTLAIGAGAFSLLGIALTAICPNEDAAPAVTNVATLPLYFLSGVFIPESEIPDGVLKIADIFPIRHFFEAFFSAFVGTSGAGFEPLDLLIVAAWGLVGLALAVRFFRWTPRAA